MTGIRLAAALALTVGSLDGPAGEQARTIPVHDGLKRVIGAYLASRADRFPAHDLGHPATALFVSTKGERLTLSPPQGLGPAIPVPSPRVGAAASSPAGSELLHEHGDAGLAALVDEGLCPSEVHRRGVGVPVAILVTVRPPLLSLESIGPQVVVVALLAEATRDAYAQALRFGADGIAPRREPRDSGQQRPSFAVLWKRMTTWSRADASVLGLFLVVLF